MTKIVAFLPAWIDGCGLYRMFLPHLHVPNSRFIFHPKATPFQEFVDASVAVVQRQCTEGNYKALVRMKETGLKVVYDLDDDLWNIPGTNPAKRILMPMREGFAVCASLCDAVTVSTGPLATAVKTEMPNLKAPVYVIPNAIDLCLFKEPDLPKTTDRVVIGWGGSNTHFGDIAEVWKTLPWVYQQCPNAWFEFVGMNPPTALMNVPRVSIRPWVDIGKYASRFSSWSWDIVLAPLDDNRFNRSKSNIKMLEAAAVNAPCLASRVRPYEDFCAHDKELDYLLCTFPSQWKTKLRELVNEPERRTFLAERMRKVLLDHYQIQDVSKKWMEVFESV